MSDRRKLVSVKDLELAIEFMRDCLDDIGGCDHSVGICCCAEYDLLDRLEEARNMTELDAQIDTSPE